MRGVVARRRRGMERPVRGSPAERASWILARCSRLVVIRPRLPFRPHRWGLSRRNRRRWETLTFITKAVSWTVMYSWSGSAGGTGFP